MNRRPIARPPGRALRSATGGAAGLLLAGLFGCDAMLVSDVPRPTGLGVSFTIAGSAAAQDEVLDKADKVFVRVSAQGAEPVERLVDITPADTRVRVQIELPAERVTALVTLQLRRGAEVLYSATDTLTLTQGSQHQTQVTLVPVAAQMQIPASFEVGALGQPVQLPGAALFATGDPVPLVWSTTEGDIDVTPEGSLTARQNGTFTVTATGGDQSRAMEVRVFSPPASVSFVHGGDESNFPGEPLPASPAARVTDAAGFALRGVEVSFSADSTGTVSHAVVTTDDEGLATLPVWTLGNHGPNTLRAAVAGAGPTFMTVNTLNPCQRERRMDIGGGSVSGTLIPRRSCTLSSNHRIVDFWTVTQAEPAVWQSTVTSTDFGPFVAVLRAGRGQQISGRSSVGSQTTAEQVLPAGEYDVAASTRVFSDTAPVFGDYEVSTRIVSEPQDGCIAPAYAVDGSIARGRISSTDCLDQFNPDSTITRRWDEYVLFLTDGQTATATLTPDFDAILSRWAGGEWQEAVTVPAGQSISLSATSQGTLFHAFAVLNDAHDVTGSYTISFSSSAGARAESQSARPMLWLEPVGKQ